MLPATIYVKQRMSSCANKIVHMAKVADCNDSFAMLDEQQI